MTSPYGLHQLRVEVPTLEPDAVLLDQLVSLSSASAPAATSSRASSMKVLLAAAGVAVVATTTWAAGAVPGKLFPARPASHPHTVVPPTSASSPRSGPTATRAPGASHPTSEAPGVHPTHTPAGTLPPSLSGLFGAAPDTTPPTPSGPKREHTRHHHHAVRHLPVAGDAPQAGHTAGAYDHTWGFGHHGGSGDGSPDRHVRDGFRDPYSDHTRYHHDTRSEESSPP